MAIWYVPAKANSAFHPSAIGKWVPASAGKAKAGMVHSVSGWTRGVQVKLWDPLRTRVIPERLRGVLTTRRYTNTPLPLHLPAKLSYLYVTKLTPILVRVLYDWVRHTFAVFDFDINYYAYWKWKKFNRRTIYLPQSMSEIYTVTESKIAEPLSSPESGILLLIYHTPIFPGRLSSVFLLNSATKINFRSPAF